MLYRKTNWREHGTFSPKSGTIYMRKVGSTVGTEPQYKYKFVQLIEPAAVTEVKFVCGVVPTHFPSHHVHKARASPSWSPPPFLPSGPTHKWLVNGSETRDVSNKIAHETFYHRLTNIFLFFPYSFNYFKYLI